MVKIGGNEKIGVGHKRNLIFLLGEDEGGKCVRWSRLLWSGAMPDSQCTVWGELWDKVRQFDDL